MFEVVWVGLFSVGDAAEDGVREVDADLELERLISLDVDREGGERTDICVAEGGFGGICCPVLSGRGGSGGHFGVPWVEAGLSEGTMRD